MKKLLVVSAVNIVNGGPLTILKSFLDALQDPSFKHWRVVALVNPDVNLDFGCVERLDFALPKRAWLLRVVYEYWVFKRLSARLKPDVWLSLHDMTPNVTAPKQFVYCHNPAPFYKVPLLEVLLDQKFYIFNKLYLSFYRININKNQCVIVQQQWMKRALGAITSAPIHVSHPEYVAPELPTSVASSETKLVFVYPAFPRIFKNHEVLCRAIQYLDDEVKERLRIVFTIRGDENLYARSLKFRFGRIPQIQFVGHLSYSKTQELLTKASGLLFPSKLETWGLPLTEAKHMGKPIIAANLEYAKETVGDYGDVAFVSPDDPKAWAKAIANLCRLEGKIPLPGNQQIAAPDSVGPKALLSYLLNS